MIRICLLGFALFAAAANAGDRDKLDPYKRNGEPNYRYRSTSGVEYQYDLSKPGDQIRYEVDPAAQLRDSINVDPRIQLDRDLGMAGGGARQR